MKSDEQITQTFKEIITYNPRIMETFCLNRTYAFPRLRGVGIKGGVNP